MVTPDDIEALLSRWADYREAIGRTALGYPSSTAESRAGTVSGPKGTIVPGYIPGTKDMVTIDKAVARMDTRLHSYVISKYCLRASERELCDLVPCKRHQLRLVHRDALYWLSGWLTCAQT